MYDDGFDDGFSPVFEELQNIQLTDAGKVQLLGFSDATLLWADRQMRNKKVKSPFFYFLKLCKNKEEGCYEEIDYNLKKGLIARYNIRPNSPYIKDSHE